MNSWNGTGRLVRDPEVRYSNGSTKTAFCRITIACDRRVKADDGQAADFIPVTIIGKRGEWVEKYFRKGSKIEITNGRIQTGSYTNKDGQTVYTWEVVCTEADFAESKATGNTQPSADRNGYNTPAPSQVTNEGFMNVPEGADEDGLPFG